MQRFIPINRQVLKFIFAISIPVFIAWAFWYSQKLANEEVEKYEAEQRANPTVSHISVRNYELKEIDDANHMRWHLSASSGVLEETTKNVMLNNVKVEYFDGPTVKMLLVAPVGEANEVTKYVKLSGNGQQKVQAKGEGGKVNLTAQSVELTKNNQFIANGDVNIEWPGVAKVWGNSASGKVNLADCKEFKLMGNTRALIYIKS